MVEVEAPHVQGGGSQVHIDDVDQSYDDENNVTLTEMEVMIWWYDDMMMFKRYVLLAELAANQHRGSTGLGIYN